MIDYSKELVSALQKVLPTHHEMTLTSKTKTPCISYQIRNNYSTSVGDTIGYSKISFTVKVWANTIADIQKYSLDVDNVLRTIGFKRISTNELCDNNSTMIQEILVYEAQTLENYKL